MGVLYHNQPVAGDAVLCSDSAEVAISQLEGY